MVSNYDTIDEVKSALSNIDLVDVPLNDQTPVPTLHWMITDKTGSSFVVEKTKEQLAVYDNPAERIAGKTTYSVCMDQENGIYYSKIMEIVE